MKRIHVSLVREPGATPLAPIQHGGQVAALFRERIGNSPVERFAAVYLDSRHRIIGWHEVSVGTVNSAPVHPREVFLPAVHLSATAVIVAHNHPTGDPTPSSDDRLITERLRSAGELLGIDLLDHLVVGESRYYSFASEQTHPHT